MDPHRQKVLQNTQKLPLIGGIVGGVLVAACWALYFFLDEETKVLTLGRWSWLAFAVVGTVAAPPILFVAYRRRIYLLRHGAETRGWISALSRTELNGSLRVDYAFTVSGRQYTLARNTPTELLEGMALGSPVRVLYDPARPKIAMVLH